MGLISLLLHPEDFAVTWFCLYTCKTANMILQVIKRNKYTQILIFQGPTLKLTQNKTLFTSQKSKSTFII